MEGAELEVKSLGSRFYLNVRTLSLLVYFGRHTFFTFATTFASDISESLMQW